MDDLRSLKNEARIEGKLPPITDDTLETAKKLRSSTPPVSSSDMMDGGKRQNRPLVGKYKVSMKL